MGKWSNLVLIVIGSMEVALLAGALRAGWLCDTAAVEPQCTETCIGLFALFLFAIFIGVVSEAIHRRRHPRD